MNAAKHTDPDDHIRAIHDLAQRYAVATADAAQPDLYQPLTFLLAQVRNQLSMDVAFVSRFLDNKRLFEVVSVQGEAMPGLAPGESDPLLDTYCQRIVDGRLPRVIPDTSQNQDASQLAVTQSLRIKAYLSAPVLLSSGAVFGTVCCISHKTRFDLREADAKALQAVADAVARSVDLRLGKLRYVSFAAGSS